MEGYRSYPDDRARYQEGHPPDPDYPEDQGWYREPERYGDPQPATRPLDPGLGHRTAAPSPGPRPAPGPAPAPGHLPGSAPVPGQGGWSGEEPPPPVPRRPLAAPGSPGPGGDGVYRSKRPATAILLGAAAGLLELPALGLLWDAVFADPTSPSGVVAAACLVLALPLLAIGLYAVATGAVRAAGPNSGQAWLRPPVAYLSVALILFVAAGLAG
ncbi:MAG: hypothetical protein GEV12_04500 [Micromonosporaceae bacterium]|nr:hypothetical protein [Micromonosporaceae bacterium]